MTEWVFNGPDTASPAQFVASFVADYKLWNDASIAATESLEGQAERDAMNKVEAAYAAFLAPFIAAGTQLQLVAFGSDSTFDPQRLAIGAANQTEDGLEVAFSIRHPFMSWASEFVAVIAPAPDGAPKLRQIYYIDPYPDEGESDRLPYL